MTVPISLFRVSFLALILSSSSVIFAYNPPPQPPSGHTPNHPVAAAPAQSTAATAVSHGGPINTTYTHNASEYGVQCITSDPSWDQHINVSSCNSNIVEMCDNIAAGTAIVSQWNWSSGVRESLLPPLLFLSLSLSSPRHKRTNDMENRSLDTGPQLHSGHLVQPAPCCPALKIIHPVQNLHIPAHGHDLFLVPGQGSVQRRGREPADAGG